MKIAIYSPYLDTFGGGERYMMTIAEVLSAGNTVDILLDQNLFNKGTNFLKNELSKRFNLDLQPVNFIKAPIGTNSSAISRIFFLKKYDTLFYLTDGSIFFPTAKKNILHIQFPLAGETSSLWRKIKLNNWDLIIYNSNFTRKYSESNWPIKSEVIYPPVDIAKIKPLAKKKYILSVGRFFGYLQNKKQRLLIDVFKELLKRGELKDWSLHLAGSAGEADKDYIAELANIAKGVPIKFYPNLDYDKLIKLYGESAIYWHAAGYGEMEPIKMEHFGISTVEAMAGGCVPVVIAKGGQKEIVEDGKSGYLWETLKDFKNYTIKLTRDKILLEQVANQAIKRAKMFNKEIFRSSIIQITGLK